MTDRTHTTRQNDPLDRFTKDELEAAATWMRETSRAWLDGQVHEPPPAPVVALVEQLHAREIAELGR